MKKYINKYNILPYILVLIMGFGLNNSAFSELPFKIAVVDVNGIINKSPQLIELRNEQKVKADNVQKWINNAKSDIAKQKSKDDKDKLIKKYDAEFAKKMETINKDYASKLQKIDSEIYAVVANEAKAKGYNMVFAKNVVLFGGDDITASVAKALK